MKGGAKVSGGKGKTRCCGLKSAVRARSGALDRRSNDDCAVRWGIVRAAFGQQDGGDKNRQGDCEISGGAQVEENSRKLQGRASRLQIECRIAEHEGKQQGDQHHRAEQETREPIQPSNARGDQSEDQGGKATETGAGPKKDNRGFEPCVRGSEGSNYREDTRADNGRDHEQEYGPNPKEKTAASGVGTHRRLQQVAVLHKRAATGTG